MGGPGVVVLEKLSVVSLPVFSSSRRKAVFFEINAPRAASQEENW